MDALAIALWSVYHTQSFDAVVERCVNLRGDADSTGSVTGQLAGALYGLSGINAAFVANLQVQFRQPTPTPLPLLARPPARPPDHPLACPPTPRTLQTGVTASPRYRLSPLS